MRFFCFIILLCSFTANAQVCAGPGFTAQSGIAVCGSLVFTQSTLASCTGPDLPASGCPDAVSSSNSIWYKLHCYVSGTFGFLITPNNGGDDYDWQLMDITNRPASDVYITNLRMSLNLSATTGTTGISASGTSDINCAGATPKYNRLVNFVAGGDYLLMVTNYSNSGQGYNLTFTGGTAVLTNNAPPVVTNVSQAGCNPSQIKVDFSEDILCSSLTPLGSEFTISNGPHVITGITSACTGGSNAFTTLTLNLQSPLPPGTYTLTVNNGTDGNTLLDVCNDAMPAGVPVSFTIAPQIPPTITQVTQANCAANIIKVALSQPVQCSSISPNGSEFSIMPGLPAITSVTTNCSGTNLSTDTIFLNLQNPLANGNYTLVANVGSDGNTFINNCNIQMVVGTDKSLITGTTLAPTVTTPVSYCQGATVTMLTATGSNLLWYANASGGTGTTTAPTPSTSTIGSTIYYVSQSSGSCESPRSAVVVNVATTPTAPTVSPQVNYCVGVTASALTAAGTNIKWYTTATGGSSSTTAPTPSTSSAGTTSYFASQSIGICESPRAEIIVVVTAIPAAPQVGTMPGQTSSTVNYCEGDTPMNFVVSGTNLLWYANATGGVGSSTAPTVSTAAVSSNTYYVSQSSVGCEGPRSSITVNVNTTPAAPTLTVPAIQTYCQNSPTNSLGATGTNIKWYTVPTGGTASTTTPPVSSATAGTTIYYVSQTNGNCEGPRASITIIITATPVAPAVSSVINYCPNQTVGPLSDSVTGTNLLWYANATGGSGTTAAPTFFTNIFPATYVYYVSQSTSAASGGCEGPRAQITVNVDNFLNINVGNDTTICEGIALKLFPTVNPTGATYKWRSLNEPNSTIDSTTILNATVKPLNNSEYVLRASLGGCVREDSIKVKVITKPVVNAGQPIAICLNDSTLLSATISRITNPGFVTKYIWTPASGIRNDLLLQTYAYPKTTTLYTLTTTTTVVDYGCDFTSTGTVNVTVQPTVYANAGRDTIAVKGSPHQLQGSGATFYEWSSPTAIINNPFTKNPFAILNDDAVFYLKATDTIGCVGRDTVFIKAYNGPAYYIPTAFTPNGDGQNDIFRAIPVGFANTTYFRVFNRLGVLVFETNQYLKGWDGTYNGKPQPAGVYVWTVAGTDKDFKKVELKGTVNLLR